MMFLLRFPLYGVQLISWTDFKSGSSPNGQPKITPLCHVLLIDHSDWEVVEDFIKQIR